MSRKTGPVVQIYILHLEQPPWDAVRSGADAAICGDCFHRAGPDKARTCYVDLRFVTPVWYARRRRGSLFDLYMRDVRFGAYGDPMAVPFEVLERIARIAKSWLGYTKFWYLPNAVPYKRLLMASVHSVEEYEQARALGWRTYRDRDVRHQDLFPNEIECPWYTHEDVTCKTCKLCDGSRPGDRRRDIAAPFHGPGKVEASRAAKLRVIK